MGNGTAKGSGPSINNKLSMLSGSSLMKNPWRPLAWDEQTRFQLIETIKEYRPLSQVGVQCARILLLGHVNVGKSSFFNTVNSIFRNHVTAQAPVGSPRDQRSITTKMRGYQLRNGREGKVLNFKIVDTMGIEGEKRKGFDPSELPYILDGHVPDNHQFDPAGNISPEMPGFNKLPKLQDKIHCCVMVLDAGEIASLSEDLISKMSEMRTKVTARGIPLIVLVTKIDKVCNQVAGDVSLVYRSTAIQNLIAQASVKIGVPVSHVLPVKNYTHEIELDTYVDVLVLSSIQQMLRFTDNFFDECLNQTQTGYIQPEKMSNDAWTRNATLRSAPGTNHVKQAWSSNSASTPTAVAGRIPGASIQSTPLGKPLFNGKMNGTPSSKTAPFEMDKKVETHQILEEAEDEEEKKNNIAEDEAVHGKKFDEPMSPLKMEMNGISPNHMVVQEAA